MEVDIVAPVAAHIWWWQQIIVTASHINYCETHRLQVIMSIHKIQSLCRMSLHRPHQLTSSQAASGIFHKHRNPFAISSLEYSELLICYSNDLPQLTFFQLSCSLSTFLGSLSQILPQVTILSIPQRRYKRCSSSRKKEKMASLFMQQY